MNEIIKTLIIIAIALFLLSCRTSISNLKPGMTKQEVTEAWGKPGRVTYPHGTETWYYRFARGTTCWIAFENDVIVATSCEDRDKIKRSRGK